MYTQKKPIENTHIVRERDRRRFRELLAVLFLGVPIGLFLLLFTWQNLEVIHLGHEATRLQKQLKDVASSNKALQLELDRLTALDSVEEHAVELGFEPTPAESIVMVAPSDGASRVVAEGGLQSAVAGLQSRDRAVDRESSTAAGLKSGSGGLKSALPADAGDRGLQSALHRRAPIALAAATPPDGRR